MKKILHLSNDYFYSDLYRELLTRLNRRAGYQSDMVVPLERGKQFDSEEHVFPIACFRKWDRFFYFRKQRVMRKHIEQTIDMRSYHLIHAHFLFTNGYLAYRWKKRFRIPYIVAVRNTDINLFFKRFIPLRRLGVRILRNADRVIFLSPSYRKEVLETYVPKVFHDEIMQKTEIIPNGIHEFWLQNRMDSRSLSNPKAPRLVFAGSVDQNKNVLTTALACEALRKRGIQAVLYVAGDVQDPQIFQRLQGFDFVHYEGKLDRNQLRALYLKTDIFVMNSFHETFGLVYAEAMSQGLPVIYTKGQGFDEQFEEGVVGYHADCQNADDIADRMMDCIEKYEALSQNCVSQCSRFDWDHIVEKYMKIYQGILMEQL